MTNLSTFNPFSTAAGLLQLPEYQAAAKIRDEASSAEFIIIEGYEG